jgi:hypothetical protein
MGRKRLTTNLELSEQIIDTIHKGINYRLDIAKNLNRHPRKIYMYCLPLIKNGYLEETKNHYFITTELCTGCELISIYAHPKEWCE